MESTLAPCAWNRSGGNIDTPPVTFHNTKKRHPSLRSIK